MASVVVLLPPTSISIFTRWMLAEASGSYDCSANSVNTQQADEHSQEGNEHDDPDQHSLNKLQGMREEIDALEDEQKRNVHDLEVLENRLKNMPDFELEAHRLREQVARLEDELATKRNQASNNEILAAISELQQVLGFS
jgi:Skp family chaperone for outer membrane proteins